MAYDLRDPGPGHRDDRQPGASRLECGESERLANRRQNKQIALGHEPTNLLAVPVAQQLDLVSEPGARDRALEPRTLWAVTNDSQAYAFTARKHRPDPVDDFHERECSLLCVETHDADQLDRATAIRLRIDAPEVDVDAVWQNRQRPSAGDRSHAARDALTHGREPRVPVV